MAELIRISGHGDSEGLQAQVTTNEDLQTSSKIRNSSNTVINPATEETLQDIKTGTDKIISSPSTENTLQNVLLSSQKLDDIINILGIIADKLAIPDVSARNRVNVEAGTLPAVTTVATVTDITNITNFGKLATGISNPILLSYYLGQICEMLENGISVENVGLRGDGTTVFDGRKVVTTAGTKVQLSTTSVPCKKIEIIAETDNTGMIVVGGTTVIAAIGTRQGVPLNPGDVYTITGADDLTKVWLDSTVNGDGVTYVYYV